MLRELAVSCCANITSNVHRNILGSINISIINIIA